MEADSLERAISLGPVPFARRTELVTIYLGHSAPNRAILHLKAATSELPHECPITAQYAEFWEEAGDPVRAEGLWKTALALNPNYEPAVFGFAKHLMHANHAMDALRFADRGLELAPNSVWFSLLKAEALETLQQFYAARRLVSSSKSTDLEMLNRRARLEDWYGSDVSNSYSALVRTLMEQRASSADIASACRRGLEVSLRCGRLKDAQAFADQLAAMGDNTGRKMLQPNPVIKCESTQLVGGVDALGLLLTSQNKSQPEHFLVDYSRVLNSLGRTEFQTAAAKVHEYFEQVAALAALGTRKPDGIELRLSLNDKSAKHRTEQALRILDLRLDRRKQTLAVRSIEKKSHARRQEGTAALAIDTQSIQEALAEGKPYMLEVPVDRVPVFPPEDIWKKAFFEHQQYPGGLAEGLVTDPRLPRIYYALNLMDRETARVLVQSMALRTLAESYSMPLSLFSAALAIRGKRVELPGGRSAETVWSSLVGADPSDPAAFFRALFKRDDGRLLAFFYTLSQLDSAHQRFFTRSAERTKRFYEYFRDSTEMKRGVDHPLGTDAFAQFLREVPLNEDGTVDFPGGAEVWMVAKGQKHSSASITKLAKKVRRAVAPDDEDEILIRLAGTEYKAEVGHKSELANFIAVVRQDREGKTPMDTETALLLAQNYSAYGDLYPYFPGRGDLDTQDYQGVFDLVERLEALDPVTANIRMGELHSFLAMLTIVGRSGASNRQAVRQMLRKGLDRYLHAKDAWTDASLRFLEDLTSLCGDRSSSTDGKLRTMLLGKPSRIPVTLPEGEIAIDPIGRRHKSFREVLKLQNVPSLDVIFAIVRALANIRQSRRTDVVEANLAKLVAIRAPNDWKLVGNEQKGVDDMKSIRCKKRVGVWPSYCGSVNRTGARSTSYQYR
jgi:tetratricopeptide (TPR) repeat protein